MQKKHMYKYEKDFTKMTAGMHNIATNYTQNQLLKTGFNVTNVRTGAMNTVFQLNMEKVCVRLLPSLGIKRSY